MKIRATGPLVVLKHSENETYKNSLIAKADAYVRKELEESCIGVVDTVGESCWYDEPHPRCKPGDTVMYRRYQGYWVSDPDNPSVFYCFLEDRDILGIVEDANLDKLNKVTKR